MTVRHTEQKKEREVCEFVEKIYIPFMADCVCVCLSQFLYEMTKYIEKDFTIKIEKWQYTLGFFFCLTFVVVSGD